MIYIDKMVRYVITADCFAMLGKTFLVQCSLSKLIYSGRIPIQLLC